MYWADSIGLPSSFYLMFNNYKDSAFSYSKEYSIVISRSTNNLLLFFPPLFWCLIVTTVVKI